MTKTESYRESLTYIRRTCGEAVGMTPTTKQVWSAANEALILRNNSFPSNDAKRALIRDEPDEVLAFLI